MKREILFRGKRVDNREWIDGNLIIEDDEYYISNGIIDIELDSEFYEHSYGNHPSSEDFHFTNIHSVIPETVGQFTGLLDQNGKKIFEGDLLREEPKDKWAEVNFSCFEVFFYDGDAHANYDIGYTMCRMHNHGAICGGYIPSFKPKTTSKMIVIGNIHDNPELLKQE